MAKPGKLEWKGGRLILEIDATIRVPVELEAIAAKSFQSGIKLTKREQQTLAGILKGFANKEIANEFNISERTVKHHVSNVLRKFKVSGRGEIMALFGKNRAGESST